MIFSNIPTELQENGRFCLHQDKVPKKFIYGKLANARPSMKEDFVSFVEIQKNYDLFRKRVSNLGVGLGVFDSFCGIDIDDCITEGRISDFARNIIERVGSYSETSLSGKGIHILFICYNQKEMKSDTYYTKNSAIGLEIYQGNIDNRYLTLTGNVLEGYEKMKIVDFSVIKGIFDEFMKRPKSTTFTQKSVSKSDLIPVDNSDFIKVGLLKDEKLQDLWNDTSRRLCDGDESSHDLALLSKLMYWGNNDEESVNIAFMSSPYYKTKDSDHLYKWESRKDYHSTTLSKAYSQRTAKSDNESFIYTKNNVAKVKGSVTSQIDSFFETIDKGTFKTNSTGFEKLDEILEGGFSNQSLVTLGGGTATGKTTLALNISENIAKNRPIIYITLEMSEEQILSKIFSLSIAKKTGELISNTDFLKGRLTEEQKWTFKRDLKSSKTLSQIIVKRPSSCQFSAIKEDIEELVKVCKNETPVLVVDYLQYITPSENQDSQSSIKEIQKYLKDFAIQHDTIALLIFANNRESDIAKTTSLQSGRDTSDIEYSSDYNLQLNFTEYLNGNTKTKREELTKNGKIRNLSLIIHKNRFGREGDSVDFSFNPVGNIFIEK